VTSNLLSTPVSTDSSPETPQKSASSDLGPNSLHHKEFFANFLNRLSLKRIEDDYAGLF
jgi:hypothetical protein